MTMTANVLILNGRCELAPGGHRGGARALGRPREQPRGQDERTERAPGGRPGVAGVEEAPPTGPHSRAWPHAAGASGSRAAVPAARGAAGAAGARGAAARR